MKSSKGKFKVFKGIEPSHKLQYQDKKYSNKRVLQKEHLETIPEGMIKQIVLHLYDG